MCIHKTTNENFYFSNKEGVKENCNLKKEIGDDPSRINNHRNIAKEKNYQELPYETQLKNANQNIEFKNITNVFNCIFDNCEHAVTSWKYGKPFSIQVIFCKIFVL